MNKPHHVRTCFLTIEQAQRFLEVVKGDPLEALYVLALTTGMRTGELLALHWEDMNFEGRSIQVRHLLSHGLMEHPSTLVPLPGNRLRDIPLTSMAIEALKRHQSQQHTEHQLAGSLWDDQGLVFSTSTGCFLDSTQLSRSLRPFMIKAGLPQVRFFHDLRNGTTYLLAMLGVSISVIAELLGHKVFSSLKTLTPISSAMREEAIARLEAALRTHEVNQE